MPISTDHLKMFTPFHGKCKCVLNEIGIERFIAAFKAMNSESEIFKVKVSLTRLGKISTL